MKEDNEEALKYLIQDPLITSLALISIKFSNIVGGRYLKG